MAKSQFTDDDDALLAELGVEVEVKKVAVRTPKEERIIAGFEEIQKFVDENGHLPQHGEDKDIFERIYATRLDQIRKQQDCRDLLSGIDHQCLLDAATTTVEEVAEGLSDDELLEELGVSISAQDDVRNLRHVRSGAERKAAEEIANRERCADFDKFKPLFDTVQKELDSGARITKKFHKDAGFLKTDIKRGQFFILGGQTGYVAEVGETIKAPNGEQDARLRVIYANGTESDILLRSTVRALYKDDASRLISEPYAGPLFSNMEEEDDLASGTIYVLRSNSKDPRISERRDVIHKIGITGQNVEKRIINASNDPTFLLADVEIVSTYKLFNVQRTKLEGIIHKFFGPARLDIQIKDRFGKPYEPREWFLVPLFIIDEAVEKIMDGTIGNYYYEVKNAKIMARDGNIANN